MEHSLALFLFVSGVGAFAAAAFLMSRRKRSTSSF